MGNYSHDEVDTWSGKTSAATQRHEAAYLPWPATSCVSSPCANRAAALQEFQAPDPVKQRSPEQLLTGPAACGNPEANSPQCAVPRGQPTVPLGCILVEPQRASPARHHDNYKEAPVPLVPSAEKENSPSPERAHWCLHTTAASTQTQASRNDMADIDSSGNVHREIPLRQPLQQASMLQADMLMQDATPLVTSNVAQGTSTALKAPGTPAHRSLQLPASSKQYQHLKQRPASAQVRLLHERYAFLSLHFLKCALARSIDNVGSAVTCGFNTWVARDLSRSLPFRRAVQPLGCRLVTGSLWRCAGTQWTGASCKAGGESMGHACGPRGVRPSADQIRLEPGPERRARTADGCLPHNIRQTCLKSCGLINTLGHPEQACRLPETSQDMPRYIEPDPCSLCLTTEHVVAWAIRCLIV